MNGSYRGERSSCKLLSFNFQSVASLSHRAGGIVQLANPASLIVAEASLGEVETTLVLVIGYATALE